MASTCAVCGRPLPDRTGLRGAPSRFCPPPKGVEKSPCSRFASRIAEVRSLVIDLSMDLRDDETTDDETFRRHLQAIKGYLWSEANIATNMGPLIAATSTRTPYTKRRDGWWRARKE